MSNVHTTVMSAHGVHVFRFPPTDRLVSLHMHEVRSYLSELLKSNGTLRVVLDLEQVVLLTSEALALIVSISNTLGTGGGRIYVAGISAGTARVLEVSRLDAMIRMYPKTSDAVAALAA